MKLTSFFGMIIVIASLTLILSSYIGMIRSNTPLVPDALIPEIPKVTVNSTCNIKIVSTSIEQTQWVTPIGLPVAEYRIDFKADSYENHPKETQFLAEMKYTTGDSDTLKTHTTYFDLYERILPGRYIYHGLPVYRYDLLYVNNEIITPESIQILKCFDAPVSL
jgi:hypothetical protein